MNFARIFLLLLCISALGLPAQTQEPTPTPAQPAASAESAKFGWTAQVHEATQPEKLVHVYGDLPAGSPIGPVTPPDGHKWLCVSATISRPESSKEGMPVKLIAVNDAATAYPLAGIAYVAKSTDTPVYQFVRWFWTEEKVAEINKDSKGAVRPPMSGTWTTFYLQDPENKKKFLPAGKGFMDHPVGKNFDPLMILLGSRKDDRTGDTKLSLGKSPLRVILLFTVPANAQNLTLQLAESQAVPIPLGQKPEATP